MWDLFQWVLVGAACLALVVLIAFIVIWGAALRS